MTILYASIKRLYDAGKITSAGVAAAVTKGWITQAEADEITGTAL